MSLRIIKSVGTNENPVISVYWNEKGLVAGGFGGMVHFFPTDESPEGGLCHLGEITSQKVHKLAVNSVCIVDNYIVSSALDGTVIITNISGLEHTRILEDIEDPTIVCPMPIIHSVLVGTSSGNIILYNVETKQVISHTKIFDSAVVSASKYSTKPHVAIISSNELVSFNLITLKEENRVKIISTCCNSVAVSTDGFTAVITTSEGIIRFVDLIAFKEFGTAVIDTETELNQLGSIDYGKRFVVSTSDGKVYLFDSHKMIKERGIKIAKKPIVSFIVEETQMKMAAAFGESSVTLLDFD